jgi:glycosyltransferase involved in cell wall biosynthesis
VVIPCYNSLRFLPETLEAVLGQELPPELRDEFEVLLVDDGGSDDLSGWLAGRPDRRVRVLRQDNAGVSAARNFGVRHAAGDLVAFCDSDDVWAPTAMADLLACFERHPGLGLAHGWYDVIDEAGRPTGRVVRSDLEGMVWERLVTQNPIAASGVMLPRPVLESVGGFSVNRDRFRVDVEDWELWVRVAADRPVGLVPRVVVHYRRHGANSSTDVESIELAYRHFLDTVFADVPPDRRAFLPAATAQIELRLASHWVNDRQDPGRGLRHLDRAAAASPEVRGTAEYRRLRLTARALAVAGPPGFAVLRSVNRTTRRLRAGRGPAPSS